MERIAGTVSVKLDGKQYTCAGSIKVSPTNVTRETMVGPGGVGGYKETPKAAWFEVELFAEGAVSLLELNGAVGATAQVDLANGRTYVFPNACQVGDGLEVDGAEGKLTLRMEAREAKEL